MHQRMFRNLLQSVVLSSFVLIAAFSQSRTAHAQAAPGASRAAEISAFAGYTNSKSDYGRFRNNGGTIGVDYTRFFKWPVYPSLELRANYTSGIDITEESVLAGLKLHVDIKRRFHPYADFLYGGTKILFKFPPNPRYTEDTAGSTSFGGGVDIDLIRHFQVKVDYQGEYMDFGPNGTQPNNASFSLGPDLLTVGVVYRIPMHPHKSQRDNR